MLPKDINNITEPVYKRLHEELKGKPQVVNVDNVNNLSDDVLNNLKAGDVIRKKTGSQYHSYRVSYKEDGQGICLTYCDASLVETVSYDYVDGHWVYNSTDSTDISAELPSVASASAGQILGLNENKKPEWQDKPAGGSKLYKHFIAGCKVNAESYSYVYLTVYSTDSTNYSGRVYVNYNHRIKGLLQGALLVIIEKEPYPGVTNPFGTKLPTNKFNGGGGVALSCDLTNFMSDLGISGNDRIMICDADATIEITDTVTEL